MGRSEHGKQGEVLYTIDDIMVEGGVTNQDPRLQGLDLRGQLASRVPVNRFVVTARDERGRPISGAAVMYFGRTLRDPSLALTGGDGSAVLWGERSRLYMWLRKPGFQKIDAVLEPGENELTLQRTYLIHVTVSCTGELPREQGFAFTVSPHPGLDRHSRTYLGRTPWYLGRAPTERASQRRAPPAGLGGLDIEDVPGARLGQNARWGTATLPEPGQYRIRLETTSELPIGKPRIIELRPGDFETLVRIEVSDDELRKALQDAK
jgi:hypothetical protein